METAQSATQSGFIANPDVSLTFTLSIFFLDVGSMPALAADYFGPR